MSFPKAVVNHAEFLERFVSLVRKFQREHEVRVGLSGDPVTAFVSTKA